MAETPMIARWIDGLPDHVREILAMAGETVESFDGDVRMASTLASLAFMRAVDSEAGRSELKPTDQVELLKAAGQLLGLATKLKKERLEIMDKFDGIADLPKPANMEYIVATVSPRLQVKRLLLVRMDSEAEALARQHDIDIDEIRESIENGDNDGT